MAKCFQCSYERDTLDICVKCAENMMSKIEQLNKRLEALESKGRDIYQEDIKPPKKVKETPKTTKLSVFEEEANKALERFAKKLYAKNETYKKTTK